jgi:hypothetical protein
VGKAHNQGENLLRIDLAQTRGPLDIGLRLAPEAEVMLTNIYEVGRERDYQSALIKNKPPMFLIIRP